MLGDLLNEEVASELCAENWGSLMDLEGDLEPDVVGRGQYEGRGIGASQGAGG